MVDLSLLGFAAVVDSYFSREKIEILRFAYLVIVFLGKSLSFEIAIVLLWAGCRTIELLTRQEARWMRSNNLMPLCTLFRYLSANILTSNFSSLFLIHSNNFSILLLVELLRPLLNPQQFLSIRIHRRSTMYLSSRIHPIS